MSTEIHSLLGDDLKQNLDRFIDRVAERTEAALPQLLDDAERTAFARAGARAVMTDFIATLEMGVVEADFHAPAAAVALAQRFARDGVPIDVMLRAYRLGQELVFDRGAKVAETIPDVERRSRAVAQIGALSFRYMDGVMSDISHAYDAERERALRGRDIRRLALVRDLLAGESIDAAEAERVLDRRIDATHQAIVAWCVDGGDAAATAREAAALLGEGRPLVVGDGRRDVTVWFTPVRDAPRVGRSPQPVGERSGLAPLLEAAEVRIALGEPSSGLRGFAATKRQADLARSVAELRPGRLVTRYADVALAALLLRDEDAARAFAAEELGPLTRNDRAVASLRETLAVFLASGQDRSRTALRLGVHRNTVANRLSRAEQLLGHPVEQRAREVEAALVISQTIQAPGIPAPATSP
jgi:DNA-binding PucR family transcriptional regulator